MIYSPAFLRLVDEARNRVRQCDVHEVWHWLNTDKKFYLIDVREESEWAAGRIACSIRIGKEIIERDIEGMIPTRAPRCFSTVATASLCAGRRKPGKNGIPRCCVHGGWLAQVDRGRISRG